MPRLLLAVAMLVIALPQPARAEVPVLIVEGRGFGHGVGMAQDGAYWMGRGGASTEQILGQFFPGTGRGRASGTVRVPLVDAGPAPASVALVFPTGGLVRDAPPHQPARQVDVRVSPGARVTIDFDGRRYRVNRPPAAQTSAAGAPGSPGAASQAPPHRTVRPSQSDPLPTSPSSSTTTTTTATDPVPTTAPPASTSTTARPSSTTTTTAPSLEPPPGPSSVHPLWSIPEGGGTIGVPAREERRYRGALEATAGGGTLRLVNEVDLEVYLKGMGEVLDPSWPSASLQAQAIAARTYAMRAMAVGGEICDTQRCQVYLGAGAEYFAMTKAVDHTRGQVLTHRGQLASAVYSANGGGYSASREEGFGQTGGDYPYLRPAPYPTEDPKPWTTKVALVDVAARLGYPGQLQDVSVTAAGPSGRAKELQLHGSVGTQTRTGLEVARALRLRSTLFSVRVGTADTAPAAPSGESIIQAPPEAAPSVPAESLDAALLPSFSDGTSEPAVTADNRLGAQGRDSVGGVAVWAGLWLVLVAAGVATVVVGRTDPSGSARRWFSRRRSDC